MLNEDGTGTITEIQPRQNKLSRPATDGARHFKKSGPIEQVMVANVDQIVVVMPAANPPPSWDLLDRYLATAEASDIPALICFTKADLLTDDLSREIELYRQIGYHVIVTSVVSGLGIDRSASRAEGSRVGAVGQIGRGQDEPAQRH